ncbi:MAG: SDR family NAD(P)-dependent oxidoreductase [Thermomicrobiales bacterium]
MQLAGKTALVTGASEGIGYGIAERFIAEGAHVYLVGRRPEALQAAASKLGDQATPVPADVTVISDIHRVYEQVTADGRTLDVVVANAGGGGLGALGELTVEDYNSVFDVNVRGTLFTVQDALPLLNDGASVILIGSIAATGGSPTYGLYAAAKSAIRSFSRTWANELAPRRIRVNTIAPGGIETASLKKTAAANGIDPDVVLQQMSAHVPLGRIGHVDDIANTALFLATDQSSYITGTNITVDGGQTQQ